MGLPQVQLVKNLSVYFRMNGRDTLYWKEDYKIDNLILLNYYF